MVKIDGTGSPYIFFIQVVLIRFLLGCRYDLAFAYEWWGYDEVVVVVEVVGLEACNWEKHSQWLKCIKLSSVI